LLVGGYLLLVFILKNRVKNIAVQRPTRANNPVRPGHPGGQ